MKIKRVTFNNHKAQLELTVYSGKTYPVPYARLDPAPSSKNPLQTVYVDPELGRQGVTYVLASGAEGAVHIDHALEYNQDPSTLAELFTHKLTIEARKRVANCGLSRRELARRLHTSVPQLYRLLDPANARKRIQQLVSLLHLLDCEVELVVKARRVA